MGFIPHAARVSATTSPERWMLVLHGILGSGNNWRSFARALSTACPEWGFCLVDLRGHGESKQPPPPHTVAEAAADLVRLEDMLNLRASGIIGHSFGGKVALAYAAQHERQLSSVWILDAPVSPLIEPFRTNSTYRVLEVLEAMPAVFATRERFTQALLEKGYDRSLVGWLEMNLRRDGDQFRFRPDLHVIRELLVDYARFDGWPVVEASSHVAPFHFVLGELSNAVSLEDRGRLRGLAHQRSNVVVHEIVGAGHWLHVDKPDALVEVIRLGLRDTLRT